MSTQNPDRERAADRTRIDERLKSEIERYRLAYTCPSCVYFDPETEACSEGYPVEEHREGRLDQEDLLFCKLFEGGV